MCQNAFIDDPSNKQFHTKAAADRHYCLAVIRQY